METARDVSLVAALVTTGLMAGVYLAFSIAVLPGIARADNRTFVLAMRGMNAAILNPVFATVFGGPLVLGLVAVTMRLPSGERDDLGWVSLALGLYVVTLVVTGVVNVPLNNRLETRPSPSRRREPSSSGAGCAGTSYARWSAPPRSSPSCHP